MTDFATKRLDIDALRVFRATHQNGGVTRASEALGMTQSAVSHKIKRLETSLGCDLLTRISGAAMLTAAGEELLGYAQRILALHDEALLSLTKTDLAGRILLGMSEDTTCSDLARILGRFRRVHPQVTVHTKVRMSLVLRAMLERGELDAAIVQVFSHEVRPADIVLLREQLYWVKSPNLSLPDHGSIPFVSFDDACFYKQWAMDIGQDDGTSFETVFECTSAAGIAAAVTAGLGVALLNARHLRAEMEVVPDRFPNPPEITYVIRRARKVRNLALDGMIEVIKAETARHGGLSLVV